MKLRGLILLFLLVFGLTPLVLAVAINLPLVLDRVALFYQKAYLQNLRADFRDLDQHLASRHEMIRLLAKLPEPGLILGEQGDEAEIDRARARYTGWINQILGEQRDIVQILFLDAEGQERFWLERDLHSMEWRPTAQMPDRPSEELVVAGRHLPPGEILVSRIRVEPSAGATDPRQLMRLNLVSAIGKDNQFSPSGLVVMTIDVGGLATFYRSTLWVTDQGRYLHPGEPPGEQALALIDFPGLEAIFDQKMPGLWRGEGGALGVAIAAGLGRLGLVQGVLGHVTGLLIGAAGQEAEAEEGGGGQGSELEGLGHLTVSVLVWDWFFARRLFLL